MNAPQIYYSASTIIVKIISLHRIIDYTDPSFHFWHFNFHELISPFSQTRSIFQFPSRRISRCCEGKISVFLEGRAGEKERQGEGGGWSYASPVQPTLPRFWVRRVIPSLPSETKRVWTFEARIRIIANIRKVELSFPFSRHKCIYHGSRIN